ncbi:DUF3426 domain-containing protein [Massilia luteola]|uniref:DUF3426 domain-containing protein n=1 Tax=Massilia luteola TaxID=3081751 RepID=UPI002ACC0553|nr:DUF3426 domain-containing protein [Massilia sp. Gc5]
MALATQCPHCHTTFRVAADQLKLRGGIVRCGACQRIFDGNAHLIDLDKPAPPAAADTPSTPPDADYDALPVYTLDFGHTFDPLGILPKGEAPDETQPPAPASAAPRAHVWRTGGASAHAPEAEETQPETPAPEEAVPAYETPAAQLDVVAVDATPADAAAADATAADATAVDAAPADAVAVDAAAVDAGAADAAPADAAAADAAGVDAAPADAATPEAPAAAQAPAAPLPPPPAAAYAPAGRIEPRLEPVFHAAPDTADDVVPAAAAEPPADTAMAPHTDADADADAAPAPASAYAPAGRAEPSFGLPADEEIVAQPLPDYEPEPEPMPAPTPEPAPQPEPMSAPAEAPAATSPAPSPDDIPPAFLPLRASVGSEPSAPAPSMIPPVLPVRSKATRASEARARRSKLTPTKIEPPKLRLAPDADADEPEFVKRSRRQERMGRTRRMLMALGAVVLLLALAAQTVLGFRNVLAAQHPAMKPALAAACAVLGCRVELPALAENLVIETGELTTMGPGTYALNTLLRNQGNLVLAWPSIELELTDANDKPVLRRVLAPADYLPHGTPAANGFGPHTEQPVTLHFTLAGLQPSGYHTFVFYP